VQFSQVWSDGPTWPNLLLVVRWLSLLRGDRTHFTFKSFCHCQRLSMTFQIQARGNLTQKGAIVCDRGKKGEIKACRKCRGAKE